MAVMVSDMSDPWDSFRSMVEEELEGVSAFVGEILDGASSDLGMYKGSFYSSSPTLTTLFFFFSDAILESQSHEAVLPLHLALSARRHLLLADLENEYNSFYNNLEYESLN